MLGEYTLIVPYYRNVEMLKRQVEEWNKYPEDVRIILIDDGSPEPAEAIVRELATRSTLDRLDLYRIDVDIPWNRGGARNLGTKMARTAWVVHIDIDHLLPWEAAVALARSTPHPKRWYRFPRIRIGKADETRRKDFRKTGLPDDAEIGRIHPHVDSYLCTTGMFWAAGGYDEDYSGCLGGGNPFLAHMEAIVEPGTLPEEISLQVFTRSVVKDASDWALSRDPAEFSRRRREKDRSRNTEPQNHIRFPYRRIELRYPKVIGEFETLEQMHAGKSIARFGDGEFKLISGGAQIREPKNPELGNKLGAILASTADNCLIAIPTMDPNGPKIQNWSKHQERFVRYLQPNVRYYSAFVSRPDSAPWIATRAYAEKMQALWAGKTVALVSEPRAAIHRLVERTAKKLAHIPCPHTETYAQSEWIKQEIRKAKVRTVLLSCGPAATVLAHELAGDYHALDVGSMGSFILRQLGEDAEDVESEA